MQLASGEWPRRFVLSSQPLGRIYQFSAGKGRKEKGEKETQYFCTKNNVNKVINGLKLFKSLFINPNSNRKYWNTEVNCIKKI